MYLHNGDMFRIAGSYFLIERDQLYWSNHPIKNVHAAEIFKPAPQMQVMPETQEISIERPPQKVGKLEINWLSVLLPTLLSALVLGGVSLIGGSSYGLMMLPLQLVGVVMSVINHRSQMKKAVTAEASRQEKYEAYLNDVNGTFRNVPLLLSHACPCAGWFDAYGGYFSMHSESFLEPPAPPVAFFMQKQHPQNKHSAGAAL